MGMVGRTQRQQVYGTEPAVARNESVARVLDLVPLTEVAEAEAPVAPDTSPAPVTEPGMVIDLRGAEPVINLHQVEHWLGQRTAGLLEAPKWQLVLKRAMDIVGGLVLFLFSLPVFIAATIGILLTSPGPIFYRQTRIGKYGEPFTFLKFRSMSVDADEQLVSMRSENEATGPIFKIRQDPRITPVGRVLRKLSIDELPQVFHVLSGKMSLVGARPPLPDEVQAYGQREWLRLLARPGLTCIWQTSGRSDLDFDTWVDMDIEYLLNWNLWLDVKLLVKTVPAVLTGRGAY